MKDDLVYFKTTAGEEAVQDRTRLVQRNLRLVLILVDGVVKVAGIKQEVGDDAMVESALEELRKLGLIDCAEAEPLDQSEIETMPVLPAVEEKVAETPDETPLVQADTVFDEETALQVRFAPKYAEAEKRTTAKYSPLTDISDWWESARKERAQAKEEAIYEEAYGKEVVEEVDPRPPKGPGVVLVFRWSWLFMALFGLVAVSLLVLVLFPYDNYRPEFEQRLSQALDDEVSIGEVRLDFLPYPALVLDRVSVGKTAYVTASHVRLVAEYGSLFGPRYREVQVEGVRVREAGLARFSKWLLPAGMGDASIRNLEIISLGADIAGTSINGLRGSARIDDRHGLNKLVLRAKEGDLRVEVTPGLAGVWVNLSATDWQAPFHPALMFSFLDVRGELVPGRLTINSIDGRCYDGSVSGNGLISWSQASSMTLSLALQRIAAEKLLPAIGADALVEGAVSGNVEIQAQAVAANRLDKALQMTGSFSFDRGSLRNIDLVEAIRPGQQKNLRGGSTDFQQLTGTFTADDRSVQFSGLRMSSGLMRVSGQASVRRNDAALSGSAGIEMRGSAAAARSSVVISGTTAEPVVSVSR